MNRTPGVTSKILVLIGCAVIFGGALVMLSMRHVKAEGASTWYSNEGDTQNYNKKFTVQPDGNLYVDADEGDVTITGTDSSSEVAVDVTLDGDASRLKKYHVTMTQDGNSVRVEGRDQKKMFQWFNERQLNVHFAIHVPRKFNLNLHTAGGDLVINGVNGKAEGETSGGNLDISEYTGTMKLETSGGDVKLVHADGDLYLQTSGGNIRGERVTGTLDVETSGGDIRCREIDAKLTASTSGGNIEVRLLSNKGASLGTSGGDVRIFIPSKTTADVEAESSGGDVSCEMEFSGKIKDGHMNGKINGGGNLISAKTSGGDVVVAAQD